MEAILGEDAAQRIAMAPRARPLDLIRPRLYLGGMVARRHVTDAKITHVLALQLNEEITTRAALPSTVCEQVVWMSDTDEMALSFVVPFCVDFINSALETNPKAVVLVHCTQGVSRSAAIVMAWLMRTEGLAWEVAYHVVAEARPTICPRPAFLNQLAGMDQWQWEDVD